MIQSVWVVTKTGKMFGTKGGMMNDIEKTVLKSLETKSMIKMKFKDMTDSQLEKLESELYDLWSNDRHNVVLCQQIQDVQDELTNREDEAMWRSEIGWCE